MAHIWGKRIGTTGLATVLTLSMAACGGQSAGSDPSAAPTQGGSEGESTKVLEVWLPAKATDGNDAEIWDEVVAPFEEEHNVDVTFQFISWKDYEAKYSSGISTGTGPDVGYMYVEMFPTYIDAGAVELRLIRPEKDGKQAFLITAAFPVRQITTVQSHLDSYMTRNEECS